MTLEDSMGTLPLTNFFTPIPAAFLSDQLFDTDSLLRESGEFSTTQKPQYSRPKAPLHQSNQEGWQQPAQQSVSLNLKSSQSSSHSRGRKSGGQEGVVGKRGSRSKSHSPIRKSLHISSYLPLLYARYDPFGQHQEIMREQVQNQLLEEIDEDDEAEQADPAYILRHQHLPTASTPSSSPFFIPLQFDFQQPLYSDLNTEQPLTSPPKLSPPLSPHSPSSSSLSSSSSSSSSPPTSPNSLSSALPLLPLSSPTSSLPLQSPPHPSGLSSSSFLPSDLSIAHSSSKKKENLPSHSTYPFSSSSSTTSVTSSSSGSKIGRRPKIRPAQVLKSTSNLSAPTTQVSPVPVVPPLHLSQIPLSSSVPLAVKTARPTPRLAVSQPRMTPFVPICSPQTRLLSSRLKTAQNSAFSPPESNEKGLLERQKILQFQIRDFEYRKKRTLRFIEDRRKNIPMPEAQAATIIQRAWRAHIFRHNWALFIRSSDLRAAIDAFWRSEQLFANDLAQLIAIMPAPTLTISSPLESLSQIVSQLNETFQTFLNQLQLSRLPKEESLTALANFIRVDVLPLFLVYSTMLPEALLNYRALRKSIKKTNNGHKLTDEMINRLLVSPLFHLKTYEAHFKVFVSFPQAKSFSSCLTLLKNIQSKPPTISPTTTP